MTPSPKQPTNEYGQPVDEKGHVLKTRERVAKELLVLPQGRYKPLAWDMDVLVGYIMDKLNDEYYRAYKMGLMAGRRDMATALTAAVVVAKTFSNDGDFSDDAPSLVEAVPVTDLQAIIDSAKEEQ
jgi:hypothetical protein